jgi:hypothetical protein
MPIRMKTKGPRQSRFYLGRHWDAIQGGEALCAVSQYR